MEPAEKTGQTDPKQLVGDGFTDNAPDFWERVGWLKSGLPAKGPNDEDDPETAHPGQWDKP